MKISATIISFFIFISSTNAQDQKTSEVQLSKHELSIFTENFLAKNQIYYSDYGPYYDTYYGYNGYELEQTQIGLGYKFHFAKSAIRSRVSFGTANNTQDNGNGYKYSQSIFSLKTALGYEFHYDKGKAQLYYGADLVMNLSNNLYKTDYQGNNSESKSNYNSFGISPVLGFKYHFTPSISLSTEIRINIESYKTDYTYTSTQTIEDNNSSDKGIKTNVGPKGFISLNFHL